MDPQIQLLLEVLDHAYNKPGWHGPNLSSSFRGLDARTAARSIFGRKSIWQQVLHAAYWKQRVLNRIVGTQRFPRPGSNWPTLPETISNRAWKEDVALLDAIHQSLRGAVARLDLAQLDPKLRKMIYGVAAHDVYHAGQIRLLRKMLEA
jgi:hypothetical protein